MKRNVKFLILIVFLLLLVVLIYFLMAKKNDINILIVEAHQIKLYEGTSYTIKALTYPNETILTYSSSDESVAIIDEYGNLESISEGVSIITISSGNLQEDIEVIVSNEDVPITGVDIEEISGIKVGEKYLLTLNLYPADATSSDVYWESSDNNIISINDGYIVGLQQGIAQITATTEVDGMEISDSINVRVGENEDVKISKLSYEEEVITVNLNQTYQLSPVIEPSNATNKNIEYTIIDNSIIEINGGVIKGLAKGETNVVAKTAYGQEVYLTVKVKSTDGIVLNIDEISIAKGEIYQLKSNFVSSIDWYSSDNKVATVTDGLIKGINDGIATITVINGYGRMNTVKVTVEGNGTEVSSVVVDKSAVTIKTGSSYQIKATVLPSNATNKEVTYETSDSRIAIVDDAGLITGKVAGTCYITVYSSNEKTAQVKVTVTEGLVTVDNIEINPDSITLLKGDSYQLSVNFIPNNISDKTVSWSSEDSSISSVSDGLIKGLKTGETIISATSNGITDSITVIVRDTIIAISSVSIDKDSINLEVGQEQAVSVSYLPSNASNKSFKWTSSDNSIATVNSGKIVGVAKGTVTITCESNNGIKDTLKVTVTKQTVEEATDIYLNKSNVTLQKGETKQLRATILPLTVTGTVVWASGNESVVKVDQNGLLTAVGVGTTTIGATYNGKVAKATVIVAYQPIYDSGAKTLELLTDTLKVTMTENGSTKVVRVWVADPYNQFHKIDATTYGGKVGDLLNSAISSFGLTNSVMIGSNASFTSSNNTGIPVGNFIMTEGVVIKETPGAEISGLKVSYFGITSEGAFKAYEPSKRTSDQTTAFATIKSDGVKNTAALTFETILVLNGKLHQGTTGNARRIGLCQVNTNNFIYIIAWGTTGRLASLMMEHGCITGVQLDSGGSTNLYYKNSGSSNVTPIYSTDRRRPEAIFFAEY